jgi:hypothetical protein
MYAGFGAGLYFEGTPYPGARLLLGTNISHGLGLELVTHITGIGRPFVSLESRIPL